MSLIIQCGINGFDRRNHLIESVSAGLHTIAVVAERTGLSRDVLRVWERRYLAAKPERSAGGQRLYSDEELARFHLLAQATRFGRAIGSVARLTTGELETMLAADQTAKGPSRPSP